MVDLGHRSYKAGIAYILFAWLFFTLATIASRFAMERIPLSTVLFFQNIVGFISVLPWLQKHKWGLLRTERFGLLFFRSFVSLAAVALGFLAVQRTTLVDTMLLNTSSPLWIPFVALIWRKIPINHILWPGLIVGFVGVLCILHPGKEILQIGALLALGAGIFSSINMVSLRILSYTERNHTVMFYYFLICSVVTLPFSIAQWITPNIDEWIAIAAVAIFFTLGQWTFVRAFHHARASHLGPFCYSAVIYSVLIEWAMYGKIPEWQVWVGIALVCAGGLWAIRFSEQK